MVKKIAEKFNRLSRVHQSHRQTTDRQTTDGRPIAYSERNVVRSLKTTKTHYISATVRPIATKVDGDFVLVPAHLISLVVVRRFSSTTLLNDTLIVYVMKNTHLAFSNFFNLTSGPSHLETRISPNKTTPVGTDLYPHMPILRPHAARYSTNGASLA